MIVELPAVVPVDCNPQAVIPLAAPAAGSHLSAELSVAVNGTLQEVAPFAVAAAAGPCHSALVAGGADWQVTAHHLHVAALGSCP